MSSSLVVRWFLQYSTRPLARWANGAECGKLRRRRYKHVRRTSKIRDIGKGAREIRGGKSGRTGRRSRHFCVGKRKGVKVACVREKVERSTRDIPQQANCGKLKASWRDLRNAK
jgi:hypothetical protein